MATNIDNRYTRPFFVTVCQTSDKLTLNIDRNFQFDNAMGNGQLVREVSRGGFGSVSYHDIHKDGTIGTAMREGLLVYEFEGCSLISTLYDSVKCSDTATNGCFGGDGTFAEPLEPNRATKNRTSAKLVQFPDTSPNYNDLPQEIKDQIMGEIFEPHTVTAYLEPGSYAAYERDSCVVVMDREFADIPLYHVCREFREYAIKTYGVPKEDRFPFDPKTDILYMRQVADHRIDQLLRTDHEVNHKRSVLRVFWNHNIDHELWDRIQTVESEARMPQENRYVIPWGFHKVFRKLHTWRILMVQFDTCKQASDPATKSLTTLDNCTVVGTVMNCLSDGLRGSWDPKTIEICYKNRMCSNAQRLTWQNTPDIPCLGKVILLNR